MAKCPVPKVSRALAAAKRRRNASSVAPIEHRYRSSLRPFPACFSRARITTELPERSTNPLRVGGAALVGALALVAAGCGGASSPSSSATTTAATTTTGSGTQSTAFKAFQTCLANAGIKSNFGGGRPGGTRPAGGKPPAGGGGFGGANLTTAQRKAFTACQSKLPAGSGRGGVPGRRNGGAANPALAKYTTCLKQHGVTLGASTKPATFKKASAACAKYAPSGATAQ